MKIAERYARATHSSNLKCDDRHTDTDTLMAIALCGVNLGPLVLRAKMANDVGSLHELKRAWLDVVARKAFMHSWPDLVSVKRVSAISIEYWLNDICPVCTGKKSDQIDNTPCLTGVDCSACDGTGKRPIPCDKDHAEYARDMAYALDAIALSSVSGAADMLRHD